MLTGLKGWWEERQRVKRLSKYYSMKGNTADRPHNLTLLLSLMSPLLAIAAVTISFNSVRLSQQSLQVSQRAYLDIDNATTAKFGTLKFQFLQIPSKVLNSVAEERLRITVLVHNRGNTPADIESISAATIPSTFPAPKSETDSSLVGTLRNLGVVGPKSDRSITVTLSKRLPEQEADALDERLNAPSHVVLVHMKLAYRDVFRDTYPVEACWARINVRKTGELHLIPEDCTNIQYRPKPIQPNSPRPTQPTSLLPAPK